MLIVTHEMHFARDVSTRIFYMDEGIIYEQGSAKEFFDHPKKPKTKAFIQRIDMLNFKLNKEDFDLYHFRSQVDDFANKHMVNGKERKSIQLVLEELIENILFPSIPNIELTIGISEEMKLTEITACWIGDEINPIENNDEQGKMARMILRKRCSDIAFTPSGNSKQELKLCIKS